MWGFFINEFRGRLPLAIQKKPYRHKYGILISHVSSQLFLRVRKMHVLLANKYLGLPRPPYPKSMLERFIDSYLKVLMISYNPSSACTKYWASPHLGIKWSGGLVCIAPLKDMSSRFLPCHFSTCDYLQAERRHVLDDNDTILNLSRSANVLSGNKFIRRCLQGNMYGATHGNWPRTFPGGVYRQTM